MSNWLRLGEIYEKGNVETLGPFMCVTPPLSRPVSCHPLQLYYQ